MQPPWKVGYLLVLHIFSPCRPYPCEEWTPLVSTTPQPIYNRGCIPDGYPVHKNAELFCAWLGAAPVLIALKIGRAQVPFATQFMYTKFSRNRLIFVEIAHGSPKMQV